MSAGTELALIPFVSHLPKVPHECSAECAQYAAWLIAGLVAILIGFAAIMAGESK